MNLYRCHGGVAVAVDGSRRTEKEGEIRQSRGERSDNRAVRNEMVMSVSEPLLLKAGNANRH